MTTPELLQYVQAQLAAGTPIPAIRQNLLASGGWTEADIAEAFAAAAPSMAPAEVPPPPPPSPNPLPNSRAAMAPEPQPLQAMPAPITPPPQSFVPTPVQPLQTPPVQTMPTTPPTPAQAVQPLQSVQSAPQQNYSFPTGTHPAINVYADPKNLTTGLQHPIVAEPKRSHKGLIATLIILILLLGGAGAAYAMPNVRAMISTKITSLEQKFGFGPSMQPPTPQPTYTPPVQPATSSVMPAASSSPTSLKPLSTRSQFAAALAGGGTFGGICYFQDGGKVYMSLDNKNPVLVPEADPATFQDLSIFGKCFGKDKNYAYHATTTLADIDPTNFKLLYYLKGSGPIFFQDGSGIVVFHFSPLGYTTANPGGVYLGYEVVKNGDAATFIELRSDYEISPFTKDKNNVYCLGSIIPGANPSTATTTNNYMDLSVMIGGTNFIYDANCKPVSDSNP